MNCQKKCEKVVIASMKRSSCMNWEAAGATSLGGERDATTHICSPQVLTTNRTKETDRKRINNGPRERCVDTNKGPILRS